MADLRPQLSAMTEVSTSIRPSGGLGLGGGSGSISWSIGGPDLDRAAAWAEDVAARLADAPGLSGIEVDYAANQPGASLDIDRTRAQDLGLDSETVARPCRCCSRPAPSGNTPATAASTRSSCRRPRRPRQRSGHAVGADPQHARRPDPAVGFADVTTGATVPSIARNDRLISVNTEADLVEGTTWPAPSPLSNRPRPSCRRALAGLARSGGGLPGKPGRRRDGLRNGAADRVPGAGGAVRELSHAADDHADGAPGPCGGGGDASADGGVGEHLFTGGDDPADRDHGQERHPDRRVRQPAARGRAAIWSPPRARGR